MSSAPSSLRRHGPWALAVLALLLHFVWMYVDGWPKVLRSSGARDWASYYYAVVAAFEGLDPYLKQNLEQLARAEGTRGMVHPFFYPPPYLLTVTWAPRFGLEGSYQLWYWLDGVALGAALAALYAWWPRRVTLLVLAGVLTLFTPLWNNHVMGQANLPVLALALWGTWLDHKERPVAGGALVGLACMMKMSPGLLVAWWLLRGRWTAAFSACAAAVLLSLATLPLLGFEHQLRFYTEILPGFSSGEYAGLTVPIDIFANHSVPDLWNSAFPGGGMKLSPRARLGAGLSNLALVAGAFAGLRRAGDDSLSRLCTWATLMVLMLMVPVYTYEHHLVWLALPMAAAAAALVEGRLSRAWIPALALAVFIACFPLVPLKQFALKQGDTLSFLLGELKFAATVTLGLACYVAARRKSTAPGESPA
ncbi:MAG: DUF2029 domain-containing protein [Alphaproteobacteria bacterium]|nr:DUF2029 domain-containing protein [Alphaproteobacteria bacterium]